MFGYNHGTIVVDCFNESVYLHDLQHRALAPREREQNVGLMFTPQTGQDLFVACLWTCVEDSGDEPGFYSFAAITDDPPPEVAAAGHDRCLVPLREQNIDAWLNPHPANLASQLAILDDRERPYYEHEIVR